MRLYQQALAILADTGSLSVISAYQLRELQDQAKGTEQCLIAGLWEAFIAAIDEDTYMQVWKLGLI